MDVCDCQLNDYLCIEGCFTDGSFDEHIRECGCEDSDQDCIIDCLLGPCGKPCLECHSLCAMDDRECMEACDADACTCDHNECLEESCHAEDQECLDGCAVDDLKCLDGCAVDGGCGCAVDDLKCLDACQLLDGGCGCADDDLGCIKKCDLSYNVAGSANANTSLVVGLSAFAAVACIAIVAHVSAKRRENK